MFPASSASPTSRAVSFNNQAFGPKIDSCIRNSFFISKVREILNVHFYSYKSLSNTILHTTCQKKKLFCKYIEWKKSFLQKLCVKVNKITSFITRFCKLNSMDSLSKRTNVVLKKLCKVKEKLNLLSESFSMQRKGGVKIKSEILLGN